MESRQKRTDKEVASKGHRRDKIENINKNTQTVEHFTATDSAGLYKSVITIVEGNYVARQYFLTFPLSKRFSYPR